MASWLSFKANVATAPATAMPAVASPAAPLLVIRMGGGKRTFPGGVSKWQWKRLQATKQRMREKAWLLRERRIYEKRKRAEYLEAMPVPENPWDVQEFPARFPSADVQLSALADRFRKPGAKDLWNPDDGPCLEQPVFNRRGARIKEEGEGDEDVDGDAGVKQAKSPLRPGGPPEWSGPRRNIKIIHRPKRRTEPRPPEDSHRLWKIEDKNRRGYNHFKF